MKKLLILLFFLQIFPTAYAYSADCLTYYADADHDGFGNPSVSVISCTGIPDGYVLNNTDCDDQDPAVYPGKPEIGYNLKDDDCDGLIDEGFVPKITTISGAYCGIELPAIDSYVYAGIVSGATGYRWRVTTMNGPNAGQVQFVDTTLRAFKITQLPSFAYETQYKIEVAVYYAGFLQPFSSAECIVTTPPAHTRLANCAYGTWISSMNEIIYARLMLNATAYRFRVTDPLTPSNTQVIVRPLREFRMNQVTAFPVHFNWIYNVDVAFRNSDGVWSEYGQICEVHTPIFPTTMVQEPQCHDGTGSPYAVPDAGFPIFADHYHGAVAYVFRIHGPGCPEQGAEVTHPYRWFRTQEIDGLVPGQTYNVSVRLIFNHAAEPGPYGKVCTFLAPGMTRLSASGTKVSVAPNPFTDTFSISGNWNDETLNVRIYDLSGRLLYDQSMAGQMVEHQVFGAGLGRGIYHIVISDGSERQGLYVVKE